jgi:hypothetical protein
MPESIPPTVNCGAPSRQRPSVGSNTFHAHVRPARRFLQAGTLCLAAAILAPSALAQSSDAETLPASASGAILNVVRWAGSLPQAAGQTAEVRFALYENQAGGLALWSETQTVKVGADGRYTVLLGATSAEGLPPALFQAGAARWIEAWQVPGSTGAPSETAASSAPPRSLLTAVPYAFKSIDAETLAGHAADEFVTQEQLSSQLAIASQPASAQAGIHPDVSPTGSGAANTIPLWTSATTLGDSALTQLGTSAAPLVGVGTATPATTLDVKGTTTFRGNTFLVPSAVATSTAGAASPKFEWTASSFKRGAAAMNQTFAFQAIPEGNNTTAPFADLYLFYGSGTGSPSSTGLHFSPNGQIGFAAGQTFPGTGTITGVTASSPLSGGGTSGAVTVGLNTTALETVLNGFYAQLNAPNTFTEPITFAAGQTFPGTGTGTITGVTAGSGLTGGGTSGAVNLSIPTGGVTDAMLSNSYSGTGTCPPSAAVTSLGRNLAPTCLSFGTVTGVTAGTGLTGGGTGGTPTLAVDPTQVPLLSANNQFTGFNTFSNIELGGGLTLNPPNAAQPGYEDPSPVLDLSANVYDNSKSSSVPVNFGLEVNLTGPSPGGTLDLLYGVGGGYGGNLAQTGLSIGGNGIVSFAPGQTFPGAGGGTITGVTAGTDLIGGGTSGNVTLNVNTTRVVTGVIAGTGLTGGGTGGTPTLSVNTAEVPFIDQLNYFTEPDEFQDSLIAYPGTNSSMFGVTFVTAGILADSGKDCTACAFPVGVLGSTDSGDGLWGVAKAGIAVQGQSGTGIGGDFSTNNNLGDATSFNYQAALVGYNGGSGGGLQVANNGYGTAAYISGGGGNSGLLRNQLSGFASGLWADAHNESAIIGSSDAFYGGAFFNNASGNPTLEAINYGGGASGLAVGKEPRALDGVFRAQGRDGVCGVSTAGDVSCTGQIKAINAVSGGARKVETYAVQSPENWIEDFGSGTLERGVAVVKIDPAFAETVSAAAGYHVFLTPKGDSKGLYVINETAAGFEVRESGGGTSSLEFDYRIVARRRGYETERLTDVTDRFNAEQKAVALPPGAGAAHEETGEPRPLATPKPN